jgi:PAS domain S-box-containing protein
LDSYLIKDEDKTKEQLLAELRALRQQVEQLEASIQSKEGPDEPTLWRTLLDNLPTQIFVKDTKSRFLQANSEALHILGMITLAELLGKTDFDLHPSDLAARYYADEQQLIETGLPLINREEPILDHQTNTQRWLLTTKVPLTNEQGQVTGILGISQEIT